MSRFAGRYGPWALVAGASRGLGAAFATELAARGLNLVLVAREAGPLRAFAATLPTEPPTGPPTRPPTGPPTELPTELPIEIVTVCADLATPEGVTAAVAAARGRPVGLVVANAAYSPIGRFVDLDPDQIRRAIEVNCVAPLLLAHRFLPEMAARRRGGFVVMSSLAGLQGAPPISVYAATKAFGAVLADGLWAEMRGTGVDVLACVAGAVATPGLARTKAKRALGTLPPERVVASALRRLGRGPRVVPGSMMRASAVLMSRVLPRRAAIAMLARASRDLTAG